MNTESSNPPPESSRNTSALSWLNQPVSMVENAKDTQTTDVAIGTILDEIKYGTDRRDVEVEHIRREYAHAIADGRHPKKAVASLKEALPGVQWSGQFSTRRADVPLEKKLIRYSCILCADIDDIQDRIAEIRAILSRCPFVFAIFLSPTGTGLKVLFRVPPDVAMHKRSFEAVRQLVLKLSGCEIDKACKDVTRLCFVSYDPELYLNASAEELPLSEYKNGTKKSERREGEDIRLHPESCIPTSLCSISLYNTPAEIVERRRIRNQAHERFEKDHPGLLKFYLQVVEDKFPAEPGARNKFLSEAVPFLFRAAAPKVGMLLVGHWYDCNRTLFKDSREDHISEAEAALKGVATTYISSLRDDDRMLYGELSPGERDAFRICRDLAARPPDKNRAPPEFFLGVCQLGIRLGMKGMEAQRILKGFLRDGLIALLEKGRPWAKGEAPVAGMYRWRFPLPSNIAGNNQTEKPV